MVCIIVDANFTSDSFDCTITNDGYKSLHYEMNLMPIRGTFKKIDVPWEWLHSQTSLMGIRKNVVNSFEIDSRSIEHVLCDLYKSFRTCGFDVRFYLGRQNTQFLRYILPRNSFTIL